MFMRKPISQEEASRIRQTLLESGESVASINVKEGASPPSRRDLIINYSPKANKAFSEYERKFPIKGFRPGTPTHQRKASERILSTIQDPSHRYTNLCWELYRLAVVEYIRDTDKSLYGLLQVDLEEAEEQAAMHVMLEASLTWSVSTEVLFEFYDLFGLKDNDYLIQETKKLKNGASDVLLDVIRDDHRKIDQLVANVEQGQFAVESLQARIKELEAQFEAKPEPKPAQPRLEKSSSSEQQVKQLEQQIVAIQQEIANTQAHCASKHSPNAEVINERLHIGLSRVDAELIGVRKTLQMLRATTREMKISIESLEAQMEAVNTRIDELPLGESMPGPALVSFSTPKAPKGSTKLTSEDQFTAHYTLTLGKEYHLYVDTLQSYIYHKLFLESPIVILENRELLDAWVSTLGWRKQCLSLIASPHWLSENDWASGVNALLESSFTPRFIIIELFDVALVQCYLLPFLHRFNEMAKRSPSLHKLFLVSSEPNILNGYPDILRYGVAIPANDMENHKARLKTFKTYIEEVRVGFDSNGNTFVPLKLVEQWRLAPDVSSDLAEIWRASDQQPIPRETQYLAQRLNASLKERMGPSEALLASIYHTAKLWCRAKHGEEDAESMFELALIEAGDKYAY
ncbi:hypothetical protein [Microbulbifer rhizosphaerae]|uniref:Uncharacterized small protein (DUF1192 family) n=1 Tax=Microbulbifer rhizosphaerae TaxID=1562603 RepID=A0A7W4W7X3_9GAMM|nr:hypothetical protein [Microbulbifer rhizosphaerae]MBB3059239.1 uncharacterized small protein (DUF1192 family) [Microbulbifer rhizosphaerae]